MSYVLLAREYLSSYPRWYAMHSNELQIGSRVSRTGWRTGIGDGGCRPTGEIKTNARNTASVTERRTGGRMAPRDCKDEGDGDKRYEGSEHVIKRKWSKWRWRSATW